jgi:glycosyltransferase involved in cell wall biosynthesis
VYKDFAPRQGGGGVARHIDGLATVSAAEGYSVRVIAPGAAPGSGDEIYSITQTGGFGLLSRRLWQHIGWADTVHVHGARTPIAAAAAVMARLRGKRLIYTPHCYYDNDRSTVRRCVKMLWDRTIEHWMLRNGDPVVLLADFWSRYLDDRNLTPTRTAVLPNCVLESRMQQVPPLRKTLAGNPALLSVGRLDRVKCVDDTIRMLAEPGLEEAVLHVVGSGPDRTRLERIAHTEALSARVEFHGFLDDPTVAAFAAAADTFVLSSAVEGMPTVIIEMILSGCPVAASDIPGNRAILAAVGLEHCLYPLHDLRALASRVDTRCDNALPAAAIAGMRAQFTWEGVRPRIRTLYGDVSTESTS